MLELGKIVTFVKDGQTKSTYEYFGQRLIAQGWKLEEESENLEVVEEESRSENLEVVKEDKAKLKKKK